VKQEIYRHGGRVAMWMHPGFSRLHVYDTEGKVRKEWQRSPLMRHTDSNHYQRYCDGLPGFLEQASLPLLLFIEDGQFELTQRWLADKGLADRTLISVVTAKGQPRPLWGNEVEPRNTWTYLRYVLEELSISTVHLFGETGYSHSNKFDGCVGMARDELAKDVFSVVLREELIYPNVSI